MDAPPATACAVCIRTGNILRGCAPGARLPGPCQPSARLQDGAGRGGRAVAGRAAGGARGTYGVGAPPVTERVLPVVYDDSSEARYTYAPAISTG